MRLLEILSKEFPRETFSPCENRLSIMQRENSHRTVQLTELHESCSLLTLSDVHCIINSSWHCRIVVRFAVLACCGRHIVALLSARCLALGNTSLHRWFIGIRKFLLALAWILTRQRCIMGSGWCSSVARLDYMKLHARQRIANGNSYRLLCYLKRKSKISHWPC